MLIGVKQHVTFPTRLAFVYQGSVLAALDPNNMSNNTQSLEVATSCMPPSNVHSTSGNILLRIMQPR